MAEVAKYLTVEQAAQWLRETAAALGTDELVAVRNLGFIPHARDLYLLSPQTALPLDTIAAFAVDMDGTSTTTEPLALHALEYMMRCVTNRMTPAEWPGLDAQHDIPFVIGNSNFRHTEFLLQRYADALDRPAFCARFIEALLWTMATMDDRQRLAEVRLNARNCGLATLLDDPQWLHTLRHGHITDETCAALAAPFIQQFGAQFAPTIASAEVSAALDIYYYRYHAILHRIRRGHADELAATLLGDRTHHLVAPMPGYSVFLCLIKGWLDERAAPLAGLLRAAHLKDKTARASDTPTFVALCRQFQARPAKVALVTASIAFEAHVVMKEVIRLVRAEVAKWPVPTALRRELRKHLHDYHAIFDGFVTASDASEARLKPHRDLYSISFQQMAIARDEYPHCMAIEDTEPGILSARAAGFGVTIGLPNHDTSRQNYAKASRVVHGGLPELVLDLALCLKLQELVLGFRF